MAPGRAVEVAPGVVRIVAPNPGIMTGPGTNTYLVGTDDLVLIDPGPNDDDHLVALLEAVGDRLKAILVTHTHVDHSPLSARLGQATGAPIVGFGLAPPPSRFTFVAADGKEKALDPHDQDFAPQRLMADGDRLDVGDFAIEAVYTPGHASNHLCFELAGTGLLFSGDHVMNGSTVVIAPPDGDMAVYLESLEKVRSRSPRRIAPGHGEVIEDPAAVLDDYLRHRLERQRQVLSGLGTAPSEGVTADQLVEAIYREVPKELHPVARFTVWAHLRQLGDQGRAVSPDREDPAAPWRPVPWPSPSA
jgi:glyoxylase-like metal-dependent hydrolase (beta-lactamase superfamily II)